ncbi:hypothetical protein EV426DRAFT_711769 [Tirmania nivea]|nr:hypothetical protein EV426DRAFT_711769 [Tirmania nivea]
MASYGMMGCCDTYASVRPNVRRTVTAPSKREETPQSQQGEPKHLPTVPCTSRIDIGHPPPQRCTPLNEGDLKATGSLHPPAGSITRPSAWYTQLGNALEPELRLLSSTARTIPFLQSDPTPGVMVTLNRNTYAALKELTKHLETHSLFHTHADPNAVTVVCINDLPAVEYHELYNLLAPLLEGFRIKIDFDDTTLIMRRPSQTHESGIKGWNSLGNLLQTQMRMTQQLRKRFDWQKGQPDVQLPPLSAGCLRIKCPDACLGRVDNNVPTLVLETGYSQTPGQVHIVAKTWLWRLIEDGIEALEDHAVQCVIVFKINEKLSKHWLPAFRQSFERHNFNLNQDQAPDLTSFVSKEALQSIALTVEIWRNEKHASTGELKRERTVRNRPTCTIPVCISAHNITTEQLFDTWIWEYLLDVRDGTHTTFQTLQDHTPIPRSTISAARQNTYFTLYLDDLTSPTDIPQNRRGAIWMNVPIKLWVWGFFLSEGVGFKGWEREVVDELEDDWAQVDSGNKENRNPTMDIEDKRRVQTRVKRRKEL